MTLIHTILLLQALDVITTLIIVRRLGGKERNPVILWLAKHVGFTAALLIIKAAFICLLLAYQDEAAEALLLVVLAAYAAVVGNNVAVLYTEARR